MRACTILPFTIAATLLAGRGDAIEGSGAPWGARDPTPCVPLTQAEPPSGEQAATLLQCKREIALEGSGLWLLENVVATVGEAGQFRDFYNVITMPEADTTQPVHALSGGWTSVHCTASACTEHDYTEATGACWRTTSGSWACDMAYGTAGPYRDRAGPPR